jgi:glycerol-3-phosphate acyltransferase PlsY
MRMAGFWAGFTTGLMDLFKGALAVYISGSMLGGNEWIEVGAGLLAILGHNYSIFLIERKEGVLRLRGGAGGATATGVVLGLWPPALLFIIPISIFLLYVVGYASLGTLSIGLMTIGIFSFRAAIGEGPWAYAAFGVCTLGLLVWALRPNIRRLLKGEERLVGWRAQRKVPQEEPEIQNRT